MALKGTSAAPFLAAGSNKAFERRLHVLLSLTFVLLATPAFAHSEQGVAIDFGSGLRIQSAALIT
jgi:hypothetical protein